MSGVGSLSRSSSMSSMECGAPSPRAGQMQVVDVGGDLEGPQLKRLDFMRAQGGFWLTWVRESPAGDHPFRPGDL